MTKDDAVLILEGLCQGQEATHVHIEAIVKLLNRNRTLERALSDTYEEVGKLGAIL